MSTDDYQIRRPLDSDREQWNLLWQGYLTFYESSLDRQGHRSAVATHS